MYNMYTCILDELSWKIHVHVYFSRRYHDTLNLYIIVHFIFMVHEVFHSYVIQRCMQFRFIVYCIHHVHVYMYNVVMTPQRERMR